MSVYTFTICTTRSANLLLKHRHHMCLHVLYCQKCCFGDMSGPPGHDMRTTTLPLAQHVCSTVDMHCATRQSRSASTSRVVLVFLSLSFLSLHGRKSTKRRKENFEHELHLLPDVRCPCRMRHSSARTALRHLSTCYFPTSSLGHLATLPGITPLAPLQPYGPCLCACHRLFPTIVSTLSRPGTLVSSPEQCLTRCGPPNDPIVTHPVLLGMICAPPPCLLYGMCAAVPPCTMPCRSLAVHLHPEMRGLP